LIPEKTDKYKNRSITIGSVTDPYQSVEKEFKITRKILKKLIPLKPKFVDILTKSDLIVRDIDLIKQFDNCQVAISLSMLNESLRRQLEPSAPPVEKRLTALKELHQNGIPTCLFISPIFPEITDWKAMIKQTNSFVGEYWFENLNLYPSIKGNIYQFLKANRPKLVAKYREIYSAKSKYWNQVEEEITNFCTQDKISYKIYFHH
jgi:DNA repair photolyase